MQFSTAVKNLLDNEGGLINHPRDPGGITKYGISLKAYPALGADGIRNLTVQDAKDIYERDYWNALRCEELPEALRYMVFDCAVNQGPGFAATALQSAVSVRADGLIGDRTIAAAHKVKPIDALKKLSTLRYARYYRHPEWKTFGSGWINRLFGVMLTSMEK